MTAESPAVVLRKFLQATLPSEWAAAVEAGPAAVQEFLSGRADVGRLVGIVAEAGWLAAEWPPEYGGLGLSAAEAVPVRQELARWKVGTVESAIGTGWIGPALIRYAAPDLAEEVLPPIARNEALWCQLFSEPEAGSDLAAVRTRAERTADDWLVNGTKIWTSRADKASWGLAVVRTDADVAKHAGLTCLCVDMAAAGVSIRPIRQMTGDAEFFEVTFDDLLVKDRYRVGEPGQGWEIVRAVLALERIAGSGAGAATPGSIVGRSVAELVSDHLPEASAAEREAIVRLWVEEEVVKLNNQRNAELRAQGLPPIAKGTPFNKVLQAEHTKRLQRLFLELGGARLLAHERDDDAAAYDVWAYLRVQPKTIAGGTSEVLRDQIAERGLGLPREADPSRSGTWRSFVTGSAGDRNGEKR
ncbi:acyl-CoA dehydrogenase [Amycolatopsis sp. WAC 04197]|uniref:acyl-CoA dehydrogenase family protein n=1 Tax=Amycolatopsis sp. WAC 04197 TaxID=2203199 RepID=UPI000F77C4C2|nr:acyl-CoA dehydrogenase family protein [Amycolatopsis sp. WAC 04197]RSN45165.1 acyl-CoA dehydrogenase [Amycolatopsis sp. WAC 04197]